MPYLVELPDGRSVEFPDEVTPDQAGQILRKQFSTGDFGSVPTPVPPPTTIGGELLEVLKGLPRGAAGLLETATAGAAALLPDEAERELRGEIEEFFKPIQQGLAAAPGYEESIGAKAGEALGSTLPFLAAGPFGVAGRVAATGLGVAAGAGEARLRAEQEGGMEERGAATALGALVGTTEVLPIFRILNRLPEKEVLGVLDYVKRAAMAGGEEFAQEASANVAQNLIEKGLYNPEQDVFEGSVEEGAYGFGVGAFIQGLVDLAVGRRARGVAPPPGEENEPTGIGAGQTVAGAGAGGDGLPVSLDGTEGPDLEGAPAGGVGVPRTAPERADEREGEPEPALGGARFQMGEPGKWYYSELKRQVERAKVEKTKPDQWLNVLSRAQGVKKEEIEETGLEEWLKLQGNRSVSKQEISNYLENNGVQVNEVFQDSKPKFILLRNGDVVGTFDTAGAAQQAIFENSVTRATELANEGLIDPDSVDAFAESEAGEYELQQRESGTGYASYAIPQDSAPIEDGQIGLFGNNYRELLLTLPSTGKDEYRSHNWPRIPNVLAHIRMDDRPVMDLSGLREAEKLREQADVLRRDSVFGDPDKFSELNAKVRELMTQAGRLENENRVIPSLKNNLFVHEIQSDWGQDARDYGVRTPEIAEKLSLVKAFEKDAYRINDELQPYYKALSDLAKYNLKFEQEKTESDRKKYTLVQKHPSTGDITDYFEKEEVDTLAKKHPDSLWPKIKILSDYLDSNYERFARLENKRYELNEDIQDLKNKYENSVPSAPFIKQTNTWVDLALKRVMTYAVENGYDSISFVNSKEVFNTIGGKLEGHKKFYDEILPQQLNKLARKLGAKVERHGDRTVLILTPEATKNIAGKLPLFRKQGRPVKTPLSVSAVQQAVKDLTQGWQNKPNIVVVGTHKDLPPAYRSDKYKSVRGMLLGNDMYIVAANAGSVSDVRSTVFHESLGHYGLRELFRTRLDDVLNDIYKTNKAVKAAADAYLKRYPDVYTGGDRYARAVEEVLAEKSENGVIKEPGIRAAFNRLAAMIRKFLRGMGLVRNYTNNDINNIMLEAAERVRSQPPSAFDTAASPRFQISQYNRVLSNAIQQNQRLPGWSQGVGDGVANAMSTMPEGLRRAQYYMYSMPQVIELLERYTPRIRAIDRFIGYRASYTTGIMKVGSDNHAKYTRAVRENPDLYEEFKNVANDINLFQVRVRDQDVIDLLRQPRASLTPQKQKYYDVARRFYALPESLQNSIQTRDGSGGLFADYRKLGDEKFDIFAKVYGGQLGSGVVRQLREQFQRDRLPMYAPLVRGEGQHWLYYETTDGRSYKTSFKSQAAREAAIREALDQGLAVPNSIVRATRAAELRDRGPPPTGFLGDVIERLEATLPNTMPAADRRQVIDGVYETFLQYMPSNMLRQELSSRETFEVDGVKQFGVLGFDEDVLDVYERTIPKMAYQLGNLKFALPIENAMKKVAEQAKLYEIAYREDNLPQRLKGRRLMSPKAVFDGVEDMRRRINFAYNPTYAPWVNGLATGNYIYSIAGNVSSALINTTVLPMMTFPSLVAQYGVMKSSTAMARASKMFAQGGVDDQGNFTFGNAATGEAKTFFNYLEKRGVIGIAAEQELQQAQRAKISGYESMLDKLNFVLGYVFKNSERFNREVTLLASFMLAREKGKSFKTAAEEAIRLNNNINGTVLPESASRLYQTNLGRVILTFRTFALTQIINLSRAFGRALNVVDATPEERSIARKQLLGIYGMTYMVAGLKGLPLFSAAEVLAAALMGDDDEPYDLQQEVLDSVGLMGLNGPLNAMFGVDIASRTGFNGMLWRDDPKRLADIGFLLYTFERIGGPSYGLIQAQIRGMEKIADGDLQRGLESMLPAPLRNPLKAARYATEGALTKDGLPIVDDVSTWNTTMQIFGFAPAELAATQEQISTKFAISDKLRNRRTAILEQIYTAMVAGDSEALQKALESVNKFNQANPIFGIDYKSIEASFRERQRRALESINGIYLPQDLLYTTEEYMADLN